MPKYRTVTSCIAVQHTAESSAIHILEEIEAAGMTVPHGQGIRSFEGAGRPGLIVFNRCDYLCLEGDYIVFKDDQLFVMYQTTFEALLTEDD